MGSRSGGERRTVCVLRREKHKSVVRLVTERVRCTSFFFVSPVAHHQCPTVRELGTLGAIWQALFQLFAALRQSINPTRRLQACSLTHHANLMIFSNSFAFFFFKHQTSIILFQLLQFIFQNYYYHLHFYL